jgi:hypothetical protein
VVYRLTNFSHLFLISSKNKAKQLEELIFRKVFRLHGLLRYIISNRDNRFLSDFWKDLFILAHTELNPNTGYHPQMDGQIESMNKWIEGYMHNYVLGKKRTWIKKD